MKFTVLFLSALAVSAADACTAVYVGKDVSADGSTVLARTVDLRPITAWQRLTFEPARSAPTNLVYSVSGVSSAGVAGGFTRDWPRETFRYVGTPLATCCGMGRFLSMGMNEKGVALTVCVSAWPKRELIAADPYVPTGIAESSITEYLIAYATSARQVVGEIGAIAASQGIAEGNIIMVADRQEAWLVETYTGHHWAAVRMPADRVAAFGNEFMIDWHSADEKDFRCSSGFFEFPEKCGVSSVRDGRGRTHVAATYASPTVDFNHLRTWSGRRWFAPSKTDQYRNDGRFDAFFVPDAKVSVGDIFEFLRNRYEGTPWCPDENGRHDIRVVGAEHQISEHVLSVRADRPPETAVTAWISLGPSEHSVFLPVNNSAVSCEEPFGRDSPPGVGKDYRERASAGALFRRLNTLAHLDRKRVGKGVRSHWRDVETRLLAEWTKLRTPLEMSEYSRMAQRQAFADARRMIEGALDWYDFHTEVVDWGVTKDGYGIEPLKPRQSYHLDCKREGGLNR